MGVFIRNRNNALIQECEGEPSADNFQPGGVASLTFPIMLIDRSTRTLYFLNASGDVVKLVPVPV